MKKILTRTFFRFFVAFMAILVISCSVMVLTSSVAANKSPAAVILGFFE